MKMIDFPRMKYTDYITPIEYLKNFSSALGGPNIYMKRDDLLGLTLGGNKTRKLEFLMADAKAKGADTIITCGAVQSNHCRLTLSAAVKEGLKCVLVLEERVPSSYKPEASGNNFLFHLLGVESIKVVPGGSDMLNEMRLLAQKLTESGRTPYIIPGGGSNEIGATGYVACAQEIIQQTEDMGIDVNHIVVASGSGGTHAGLLVGLFGENQQIPVMGINVGRPEGAQKKVIQQLALETAKYVGIEEEFPPELVVCKDNYVGPGYSLETNEMIESVQLLARTEGILLDPVYTGKVMAGLVDHVRKGYFKNTDNVLFIHTGGSPALFAYQTSVLQNIN
ncbi:D-cysteine desulfhydrase [Brevibacillus sp. NRS-1366]|uniref:D-cysteine desulfhydrase n=1 Tax=Brevibacillus sp. NRS-1366 TaxID=3233899 RepID=UPI003D1B9192